MPPRLTVAEGDLCLTSARAFAPPPENCGHEQLDEITSERLPRVLLSQNDGVLKKFKVQGCVHASSNALRLEVWPWSTRVRRRGGVVLLGYRKIGRVDGGT